MELPSKFPEGSRFWASFSGDEFVEFPDGKVFKLADSGDLLEPRARLPFSGCAPITEAVFLNCARGCREFEANRVASDRFRAERLQAIAAPAAPPAPLAWVDTEGSAAAFVSAPGFSAMRDAAGRWVSPAPSVTIGDLAEDGYRRASDEEAVALAYLAKLALPQA